jgi:hypothetical protein
MASVAKGLIRGVSTSAQGNHGAAAESELFAFGVVHTEIAFNTNGPVVVNCNFR